MRGAASQACQNNGRLYRDFMNRGLNDILNEAAAGNWTPQQIAVQVLVRCCLNDDGVWNNFGVGVISTLNYLNSQFGNLGQGAQVAFQGLRDILESGEGEPAIRGWVETHYP